ncbi:copper homeostasis periplasmic binding protein CopC [Duganella vulcania]|uniref:Copper homeostasis periplasmic binding protein CopC n=1 Tax=Duganella vulcania TaxID=2692166 RepID=A0A845GFI6_9BURK|nr:copper homeostasis periplasmic binding protein CopC [Duganella vulcania]MYM92260.1 copper homeostasis periplasmic binding protein CopC [Duganella vulcania]
MKALHTVILATAMAAATLASPFASAHATLKSSNPEAGATLAAAPKEIALTFNEKIEEAFSTITVADSQGKEVAAEKAKVDAANPTVLRLTAPVLSAGSYTVTWAVAGHDGHRRKGDFKFTVK